MHNEAYADAKKRALAAFAEKNGNDEPAWATSRRNVGEYISRRSGVLRNFFPQPFGCSHCLPAKNDRKGPGRLAWAGGYAPQYLASDRF